MKYQLILFLLILINLNSCGKDNEKKKKTESESRNIAAFKQKQLQNTVAGIIASPMTIKNTSLLKNKIITIPISDTISKQEEVERSTLQKNESSTTTDSFYLPLRRFLKNSQIGLAITKEDLAKQYEIPSDGLKLIKSITKITGDKLLIKWDSNWLVKKLSDAQLKDDTVQIRFHKDKLYISGNAIGIRYNKKVYTNLILKGGDAYIPGVKGFHWQIGK